MKEIVSVFVIKIKNLKKCMNSLLITPPSLSLSLSVQDLFKKVVPYHCLGGIWSQRDKKGKEHLAPTIRATVAQFNSVTNCVITTCLSNPTLKPNQRARLLERWIDVARVSEQGGGL